MYKKYVNSISKVKRQWQTLNEKKQRNYYEKQIIIKKKNKNKNTGRKSRQLAKLAILNRKNKCLISVKNNQRYRTNKM